MAKEPRKPKTIKQTGLTQQDIAGLSPKWQAQIEAQLKAQEEAEQEVLKEQKRTTDAVEELVDLTKEELKFQKSMANNRTAAPTTTPQQVSSQPFGPQTAETMIKNAFKDAAMAFGEKAFKAAFPGLDKIIEKKNALEEEKEFKEKGAVEATERVAEQITGSNDLLRQMISHQEVTNSLLKELIKSGGGGKKEDEKGGIGSAIADALSNIGGGNKGGVTPKQSVSNLGKAARTAKFIKGAVGGVGGLLGGMALDYAGEKLTESGHEKLGAAANIGSSALTWGGMGAMFGPVGAGVGAALGGAYGLYKNWGNLTGSGKPEQSADIKAAQASAQQPATGQGSASKGPIISPSQSAASTPSGGGVVPKLPAPTQGGQGEAVTGDQVEQILATIRKRESSGNYTAKAKGSTASGAYQFVDSTWQSLSKKYGGGDYKSAADAPADVQDKVARAYVQEILRQNNNDVSKVPVVWYTGNAQGKMSDKAIAANGGMTAEAYQSKWMGDFAKAGGTTQQPAQGGQQVASAQTSGPSSAAKQVDASASDAGNLGQQASQVVGTPATGSGPTKAEAAKAALSAPSQPSPGAQRVAAGGPISGPASASGAAADAQSTGGNGMLDRGSLSPIGGNHVLQSAAATAYNQMKESAAQEGVQWGITDSYRDYATQVRLASQKGLYSQGGLAATPGKSNHGWGLATDLKLDSKAQTWMQQNAGRFGFSTIPREPWHWEFKGGAKGGGPSGGAGTAVASKSDPAKASGEGAPAGGAQVAAFSEQPQLMRGGGGMAMGSPVVRGGSPGLASAGGMLGSALGGRAGGLLGSIAGNMISGLMQPSTPSRGTQLAQASTKDEVDKRTAKQAITVNQNTSQTPAKNTVHSDHTSSVGNVEPVDAKTRFKELFHMGHV